MLIWLVILFILWVATDIFLNLSCLQRGPVFIISRWEWCWNSAFILMLILGAAYLYWQITGRYEDIASYLLIRFMGICLGVMCLTGAIIFIDAITPGDWLGNIEHSALGPEIVTAALILALALIIIWV
jgi:hypothetical protein